MTENDGNIAQVQKELSEMPIPQRIVAVSRDVQSRKDRYAGIGAHDLAALVGVPQSEQPSNDWTFCKHVEIFSLHEYLGDTDTFWTNDVFNALSNIVGKARLEELGQMVELLEG